MDYCPCFYSYVSKGCLHVSFSPKIWLKDKFYFNLRTGYILVEVYPWLFAYSHLNTCCNYGCGKHIDSWTERIRRLKFQVSQPNNSMNLVKKIHLSGCRSTKCERWVRWATRFLPVLKFLIIIILMWDLLSTSQLPTGNDWHACSGKESIRAS